MDVAVPLIVSGCANPAMSAQISMMPMLVMCASASWSANSLFAVWSLSRRLFIFLALLAMRLVCLDMAAGRADVVFPFP